MRQISQRSLTQEHLEESITHFVQTDVVTLSAALTVGESLARLRSQNIGERVVYFYALDAQGRLVGVVPTRRLLMSDLNQKISAIMSPQVIAVPASATVLEACEFFLLHRFLAFPVVDEDRKLLGTVDVSLFTDEVFDAAESTAAKDVFQLIGVRLARATQGTPWASFRNRFPWLLCNIGGGILCAIISSWYEAVLDAAIVLALFIPVVLALAESVSIQSMTITLQLLHGKGMGLSEFAKRLVRELLEAVLLGAASGLTVGLVAWLWKGVFAVGCVLAGSIAASMVTACMLGVILPTLVRVLRGDPRIAAGPIVLASADLATLGYFFQLGSQLVLR